MRSCSILRAAFAGSLLVTATFAIGCAGGPEAPAPYENGVETEAEELAAADIDPAAEPIVDEDDLVTDEDDDVLNATYEADVDDSAPDAADEADESEEAQIDTLSISPLSNTPKGEAINGMKPRHCRFDGKVVKDCMCFFSPLNCQMPSKQRGRNRIIPPGFYSEMVSRTDAARDRASGAARAKVKTPVDSSTTVRARTSRRSRAAPARRSTSV